VGEDLSFDSEGSLTFKSELQNDIWMVILPAPVDKVRFYLLGSVYAFVDV